MTEGSPGDGGAELVASPRLIRHPDFLKLWSAETISVFGAAVTQLALPLVAAVTLGVGPFEFGLLTTIEFLPFILLSLPAGVWVDRLRRRPIPIAGDLGRAMTLGSIPVAFAFDVLTIWQLYVVAFLTGCLTVFFDVAYQSHLLAGQQGPARGGELEAGDLPERPPDPGAGPGRHPGWMAEGADGDPAGRGELRGLRAAPDLDPAAGAPDRAT